MSETVVNKSKSCVSFKVLFLLLNTRAALPASKYSLGSYHTSSYTTLKEYSNNLTASLEAHIFLNNQGAASSSCNNSFNNKIKYKAGNHIVHVSVYFPNITELKKKKKRFIRVTYLYTFLQIFGSKYKTPIATEIGELFRHLDNWHLAAHQMAQR